MVGQAGLPQRLRHLLWRAGKRPFLKSEPRVQSSVLVISRIHPLVERRIRKFHGWPARLLDFGNFAAQLPVAGLSCQLAERPDRPRALLARSASGYALHTAVALGLRI